MDNNSEFNQPANQGEIPAVPHYISPYPEGYAPKAIKAKDQRFIAGVIIAMIFFTLVSAVLGLMGNSTDATAAVLGSSAPALTVVSALSTLTSVLVLLKYLLPGWEPHRKWLGGLLGASLVTKQGLVLLSFGLSFYITFSNAMSQINGDLNVIESAAQPTVTTIVIVVLSIALLIGLAVGLLLSPEFHLLRGLIRKKSTERLAGILSAVGLGATVLSVLILFGLAAVMRNALPEAGASAPLNASTVLSLIPSAFIGVGSIMLYFGWPVLEKPVMEKKESAEETEAQNPGE